MNDKRCDECDVSGIIESLSQLFPGEIKEVDFNTNEGKRLYEETGVKYLPAILFTEDVKNSDSYSKVERYLEPKGNYLSLRIGATFDPTAEICDNGIDDDGDGKIDCEDESCAGNWKCMEKKETPEVELFVMSYCPFGTQMEKGILPVVELLGDKIDFTVKFCDYAMHGKKELDEQLLQYCIQEEQNDKFIDYLKCFLKEGKSDECIKEVEIDEAKLNTCIGIADARYKVSEDYEDKSTWKGAYPTFNIYKEDVDKYGVSGSPTLVINGVTALTNRDPASLLDAICTGFIEKPEECNEELSSRVPSPGFGGTTLSSSSTSGSCD